MLLSIRLLLLVVPGMKTIHGFFYNFGTSGEPFAFTLAHIQCFWLSEGKTFIAKERKEEAGELLPKHFVSAESVVVMKKGVCVIHFEEADNTLGLDDVFIVPADVIHQIEAIQNLDLSTRIPLFNGITCSPLVIMVIKKHGGKVAGAWINEMLLLESNVCLPNKE